MTKKGAIALGLLILVFIGGWYTKRKFYDPGHRLANAIKEVRHLIANHQLREGDIIFQTSLSNQSRAIQIATHSPYSHCGIIFQTGSNYYVYEAVQPVKATPLDKWIARGKDGGYVIKRLKNADEVLTLSTITRMKTVAERFKGKNYDLYFEWSDSKMYCSEIIWKIYMAATGIEVGQLQQLKDFDLSNPIVQFKMRQRYGSAIPMNEKVISPVAIFDCTRLFTVASN